MSTNKSIVESGLPQPVRAVVLAVLLMIILDGLLIVITSGFVSSDSFIVDIGTFSIDLIVILFLNSQYPIQFLKVDNLRKVLLYGVGWGLLPVGIFIHQIATQTFNPASDYIRYQQFSVIERGVFFAFNTVLPAFFEETLFRGYFYRIIKNRYGIYWGVAIATILFAAAHGFRTSIIFPGLLYAYVYEKTDSIWGSFLTHFINNSLWFFFAYYVVQ